MGEKSREAPAGVARHAPLGHVPLSEELEAARRYRQRAEELRIIAAEDRTRENRDALEGIARTYDDMAKTLEKIDRTNQATRKLDPK